MRGTLQERSQADVAEVAEAREGGRWECGGCCENLLEGYSVRARPSDQLFCIYRLERDCMMVVEVGTHAVRCQSCSRARMMAVIGQLWI